MWNVTRMAIDKVRSGSLGRVVKLTSSGAGVEHGSDVRVDGFKAEGGYVEEVSGGEGGHALEEEAREDEQGVPQHAEAQTADNPAGIGVSGHIRGGSRNDAIQAASAGI